MTYLDDASLPLMPEWEEQLKQLDTIKASGAAVELRRHPARRHLRYTVDDRAR